MSSIKVDTREPPKYIEFLVNTFPDLKFERATLKEGDYESSKCLFERKKMADLYGSITGPTRRFYDQMHRMSVHTDKVTFLLVTGSVKDFVKEMQDIPKPNGPLTVDPNILFGGIAAAAYRYNIQPFWIHDEWEGLITMIKTMVAIDKGKYQVPVRRDPDILCARLLGVSTIQLSQLLDQHRSIEGLCKANKKDFQLIRGIGPAKATEIHRVLKQVE